MKRLATATLLAASLFLASCNHLKKDDKDKPAAKPGDTTLTSTTSNYQGEFEIAAMPASSLFELDITQSDKTATLNFSAARSDGTGVLPEGTATGTIDNNGVLNFKFRDSYSNEGTGTLRADGKLYHLVMKTDKVYDERVTSLYGTQTLRKLTRGMPSPSPESGIPSLPEL